MDGKGAKVQLTVPRTLRARIIAHARSESPREACGILGGMGQRVDRAYPLRNVADTPDTRYLADPSGQLAAFDDLERQGRRLLAIYHSHPASPAVPSPTDLSLALYPEARHIIISLAGPRAVLRCYVIGGGEYARVRLAT